MSTTNHCNPSAVHVFLSSASINTKDFVLSHLGKCASRADAHLQLLASTDLKLSFYEDTSFIANTMYNYGLILTNEKLIRLFICVYCASIDAICMCPIHLGINRIHHTCIVSAIRAEGLGVFMCLFASHSLSIHLSIHPSINPSIHH